MKAIRIKFIGATDTQPSRFSYSADGWPRKIYSRDSLDGGTDGELWNGLKRYIADLEKSGVHFGPVTRVAIGGLSNSEDAAVLFFPGDDREIKALSRGLARNPAARGGVRIVHNKLLGGWFVVRGPHQTPISGRFDSKAAAQAWLDGKKSNPAARKKKVGKKIGSKKVGASRMAKAGPIKKKIAVNAKSRATGKPPSTRLKKRRARNTVPGAYPNPAKRKQYVIAAIHSSGAVLGFFNRDRFGAKIYAQKYDSKEAATHDAKLAMKRLPARSGVAAFAIVPHYKSIASIEIDTRKMGKA